MTTPDSGVQHECRCGYHIVGRDADGPHTWSKCRPDSGDREVCDPDRKRGLYGKYNVSRVSDPSGKHDDCEYFVLDWDHDKHAWPALAAYATACETEFPGLARDLRCKLEGLVPDAAVSLPLSLAQRILAALEASGAYATSSAKAECRALADELRAVMTK